MRGGFSKHAGWIGTSRTWHSLPIEQAHQGFDDAGNLVDEKVREQVDAIGRRVVEVAGRLKT